MASRDCCLCGDRDVEPWYGSYPNTMCEPCREQVQGLFREALGLRGVYSDGNGIIIDWDDVLAFLRGVMQPENRLQMVHAWKAVHIVTDEQTKNWASRRERTLTALTAPPQAAP